MPKKSPIARQSKKTPKKEPGKIEGSLTVKPITESVKSNIPGATDLMKAAYEVDLDTVNLALELGDNVCDVDHEGQSARDYLFAGYNVKMAHFREMHPNSDLVRLDKMSEKDRRYYKKLNSNLAAIIELLGDCPRKHI